MLRYPPPPWLLLPGVRFFGVGRFGAGLTADNGRAAQVVPMKEQLNRRTREVRELNHMLKAWEAMRLGKDAQIASLMERCKRHEEEAAEKARSVDSLRRKLALAGMYVPPSPSSVQHARYSYIIRVYRLSSGGDCISPCYVAHVELKRVSDCRVSTLHRP